MLLLIALTLMAGTPQAVVPEAAIVRLVHELGTFPAALPAGAASNGRVSETEQRRDTVYRELRALDKTAVPALTAGLGDPDVQVRRGVALYLAWVGGNYWRHAAGPLDIGPFVEPLTNALRDPDQRVKELAAQAFELTGAAGASAVPDLVRLLQDPSEGLRNSACIGLYGIGPAAKVALPALHAALSDPSQAVRQFARRAIDHIQR